MPASDVPELVVDHLEDLELLELPVDEGVPGLLVPVHSSQVVAEQRHPREGIVREADVHLHPKMGFETIPVLLPREVATVQAE